MDELISEKDQIVDLINDYKHVGLEILDSIFVSFFEQCSRLDIDLEKDIPPNFYLFYRHFEIPYRASIKTTFFNKKKQLDIKLNNNGFNYDDTLPSVRSNINRYRSATLIELKYQDNFIETYMKNIDKFVKNIIPNCNKTTLYYNKEEKRCDIKAFAKYDEYQSNYQTICITFEPGYPEEDANEEIFN